MKKRSPALFKNLAVIILLIFACKTSTAQNFQKLYSLTNKFFDEEKYDSAMLYAQKGLVQAEKEYGVKDTNYINALTVIGELCYYSGDYPQGITYLQQCIETMKAMPDKNAKQYSYVLNVLGNLFQENGNYSEAEKTNHESSQCVKDLYGIESPQYASTLNNLATLYFNLGNFFKAEPLFEEASRIWKKSLGEKDRQYSTSLNNLGMTNKAMGNYAKAEKYFLEALKINKENIGEMSPQYASDLNNLGQLNQALGYYKKAESLLLEALRIRKESLGEKHPNYASSLNNLAILYRDMGDYTKAEPLYIEALKIRKEAFGTKHPDYAQSLNNLAGFYRDMGNYSKAEPLLIESMNIRKEVLGDKSPDYATALNNLAVVCKEAGKFDRVEILLLEAMEIRKEVFGEKHPDYAQCLNNLATLYQALGDYKKAEPLFREALRIRKEVFGEKHPDYAQALNNMGGINENMNNFKEAESYFIESIKIRKEVLGGKHPDYVQSINNLALLYYKLGEPSKADPLYLEALNIQAGNMNTNFSFLSEIDKERYLASINKVFNQYSNFAFQYKSQIPSVSETVYNIVIKTKGILLSSSNQIRDEIINSNDSSLTQLFNNWQVLKQNIGKYSQWSKSRLLKMNVNLDSLESIANSKEIELSLKSKAFGDERNNNQITWKQIQQKLDKKEVAVEFFTYKTINSKTQKPTDTTIYYALILAPEDKSPRMISLCTNFELAALVEKTKVYNTMALVKGSKPLINEYVDNERASQTMYSLIWKPIDPFIKGKETVFVSLTGMLNKISFNALMDNKKQLLLTKYDLHFLNSTRELATMKQANVAASQTIALFGGINYDMDSTQMKFNVKRVNTVNNLIATRALPSDTTRGNSWSYLEGTLAEVNGIDKVFSSNKWKSKMYTSNNATEEVFKGMNGKYSPTIIHFSTHGFFYPAPDSTTYSRTKNIFKTMKNPFWRSGILLAGANYTWQCNPELEGVEDGVLTAYEVANSNLRNTDLVVLSACETGLGDIKTGEGVYGLQRSFRVAGAGSVIMSLWQVPDKETTELMILFYENYIKTNNKHESFRKAQQAMAKKYPPFYWAAFVLVE
ncbi:MAG: CHAT domain-containing tetratricopeptide repeat protein [Bacteroidota bacterium]